MVVVAVAGRVDVDRPLAEHLAVVDANQRVGGQLLAVVELHRGPVPGDVGALFSSEPSSLSLARPAGFTRARLGARAAELVIVPALALGDRPRARRGG